MEVGGLTILTPSLSSPSLPPSPLLPPSLPSSLPPSLPPSLPLSLLSLPLSLPPSLPPSYLQEICIRKSMPREVVYYRKSRSLWCSRGAGEGVDIHVWVCHYSIFCRFSTGLYRYVWLSNTFTTGKSSTETSRHKSGRVCTLADCIPSLSLSRIYFSQSQGRLNLEISALLEF